MSCEWAPLGRCVYDDNPGHCPHLPWCERIRELQAKLEKCDQWFSENAGMLVTHRIGGFHDEAEEQ